MKQYLDLVNDILENGEWIDNPRTGVRCKTVINRVFEYDVSSNKLPLVTTRKSYWKQAINEMVGYMRGYSNIKDFHTLGVHTWDANALNWESDFKDSENDCGLIYGKASEYHNVSYEDIISNIKNNPYDRGHIWNFWYPDIFKFACLRPCMYSHQFSVIGDTMHLTSMQRSVDVPLGLVFNMVQCYFLLAVTAHLTGFKPGKATHVMVNCHIYENQIDLIKEQVKREPYELPTIEGFENLRLGDIMAHGVLPTDKLTVSNYKHHEAIKFPFTA